MTNRADAAAFAAVVALLAVPLTYAIARAAQARFFVEPDPALVVWSTSVAMYWRVALGAYVGAISAAPAYSLARRRPDLAARSLRPLVVGVALVAGAQALLCP